MLRAAVGPVQGMLVHAILGEEAATRAAAHCSKASQCALAWGKHGVDRAHLVLSGRKLAASSFLRPRALTSRRRDASQLAEPRGR